MSHLPQLAALQRLQYAGLLLRSSVQLHLWAGFCLVGEMDGVLVGLYLSV